MKKIYKTPSLRESKLKAMTILAGSLEVNTEQSATQQYSKESSIFDSVFSPAEEEE